MLGVLTRVSPIEGQGLSVADEWIVSTGPGGGKQRETGRRREAPAGSETDRDPESDAEGESNHDKKYLPRRVLVSTINSISDKCF